MNDVAISHMTMNRWSKKTADFCYLNTLRDAVFAVGQLKVAWWCLFIARPRLFRLRALIRENLYSEYSVINLCQFPAICRDTVAQTSPFQNNSVATDRIQNF